MRYILFITLFSGLAIILFSIFGSSIESESWIMAQYELGRLSGGAWQNEIAGIIEKYGRASVFWDLVAVAGLLVSAASIAGFWIEKQIRAKA